MNYLTTVRTFLLSVLAVTAAHAAEIDWSVARQYLVADQHGTIIPKGYAAGLTEIAQAEAQAEAARVAAQAVQDSTDAASNVVNEIVSVLTGSIGFGYVTGHTVSIGGVVEISTNATASIIHCGFGEGGAATYEGVPHTGHYVWHAYSETMNSVPLIKYKTNLEAVNDWEFAPYQNTEEYTDTTVNGVHYDTVYRSTVYLPSSFDTAFFLAFCEIIGGGQAGGLFRVEGGFSIGGKVGFTGTIERDNRVWRYECGALMSVEDLP